MSFWNKNDPLIVYENEPPKIIQVPVYVDPAEAQALAKRMRHVFKELQHLEAQCKEKNISVVLKTKVPHKQYGRYGSREFEDYETTRSINSYDLNLTSNLFVEF